MTRTFKLGLIVALLALAGCAAQQAHRVQVWAPGRTLAELEQCAGKPTATDTLGGGLSIAQWHYAEPNGNANIPVPLAVIATGIDAALAPLAPLAWLAGAGSPSIGASTSGACDAIATVREGRVVQLRYTGPNGGLSGRDAVCAPLMRECLSPR